MLFFTLFRFILLLKSTIQINNTLESQYVLSLLLTSEFHSQLMRREVIANLFDHCVVTFGLVSQLSDVEGAWC